MSIKCDEKQINEEKKKDLAKSFNCPDHERLEPLITREFSNPEQRMHTTAKGKTYQ